MLCAYPRSCQGDIRHSNDAPIWVDLVSPTPEEIAAVEARCGIRVPTRHEVAEIEASSRSRVEDDVVYLSAPLIAGTDGERWRFAPTGFVLSGDLLLTVRFDTIDALDAVNEGLDDSEQVGAREILTRLVEEIVDRAADHLERASEAITEASHAIFADPEGPSRLSQDAKRLRDLMVKIGRVSERMSRVRYTFLSIGRMAGFVIDKGHDWLEPELAARLEAARSDIASLDEFESSLTGRIQLLNDAATGFISIEQNDVVKLLTIVSVVGVPPVLVVGIYGMNFKYMPELEWHLGYPLALLLIVLSAVLPLLWFKVKGWL